MDPQITSDEQSNGFVNLIQTLGVAYFGAQTAQAQAEAAAAKSVHATELDSTGHPVAVTQPTTTTPQWIAGVSNQTVLVGGLLVAGLLVALALRSGK